MVLVDRRPWAYPYQIIAIGAYLATELSLARLCPFNLEPRVCGVGTARACKNEFITPKKKQTANVYGKEGHKKYFARWPQTHRVPKHDTAGTLFCKKILDPSLLRLNQIYCG